MIDVLQQIRNGCVPRRPTPQKKALATADLVRDSRPYEELGPDTYISVSTKGNSQELTSASLCMRRRK
jgi:hypothetical protein